MTSNVTLDTTEAQAATSAVALMTPTPVPATLRRTIRIEPWDDHITAEVGHDPRSAYVERFWLSVVGPSALWLLRTMAYGFDDAPNGYDLDPLDMARVLGLGERVGRHSPMQRAIDRLCHFGLAYERGGVTLVVRAHVPWLDDRRVSRLPAQLRTEHVMWEEAALAESAWKTTRRRAAGAALACARSGGTDDDVRRTMQAWRYDPPGIEELTAWAIAQVTHRPAEAA